MESVKIIGFATLSAIVYGIAHDMVTAHVCVEYFTIAHPPVFPTQSPFLLAIGWGIIATWWVGLPLGVLLAAAARIGKTNRLGLKDLRRPIVILMLCSGLAAVISGIIGVILVANGVPVVDFRWASVIPPEKHLAFSFDACAHTMSYLFGFFGGLFLIGHTVWRRVRPPQSART